MDEVTLQPSLCTAGVHLTFSDGNSIVMIEKVIS